MRIRSSCDDICRGVEKCHTIRCSLLYKISRNKIIGRSDTDAHLEIEFNKKKALNTFVVITEENTNHWKYIQYCYKVSTAKIFIFYVIYCWQVETFVLF